MKALQHKIETIAARFGLWLGRAFPLSLTRRFGATLGRIAWSILRVRRSVSMANIQMALGVDDGEARRIGRASYENLGRNLMEFIAAPGMSRDDMRRMLRIQGAHYFDEALAQGRGAMIFSGHFGAWEFIVSTVNVHDYPTHGLVAAQSNRQVDEIIMGVRRSLFQFHIPRDFSLRRILRVLQKNEFVAMLGDQDAGPDGLFVPFFGRPASTPRGAASIAVKQGLPVMCIFMFRQPDHSHVMEVERVCSDPALSGEPAVEDLTRRITAKLEAAIRKRPELYLWAHKRWKTSPPHPGNSTGPGF